MIFFDLDDTILDTSQININIFEKVRRKLNLDVEKDDFRKILRTSLRKRMIENFDFQYNESIGIDPLDYLFLTKPYEEDHLRVFKDKVYKDVKDILKNISKEEFFNAFLERRYDYNQDIFGMIDLIKDLKDKGYKLAIITNGLSEVQHRKIDTLKIRDLFEFVFVSGDFGYGKPDPKFYNHVINVSACKKDDSIMIGNNIQSDIFGSLAVGLSAIYLGAEPFNYKVNFAKDALDIKKKIEEILKNK